MAITECSGRAKQLCNLIHALQFRDHFIGVALVDEETLAFGGEVDFDGVLTDQGVEECIVFIGHRAWIHERDEGQVAREIAELYLLNATVYYHITKINYVELYKRNVHWYWNNLLDLNTCSGDRRVGDRRIGYRRIGG